MQMCEMYVFKIKTNKMDANLRLDEGVEERRGEGGERQTIDW